MRLAPGLTLMAHQEQTAQFLSRTPRAFDTSDAGSGKTLASLEAFRRTAPGRLLVLAPLSIMQPSWGNDIDKFFPGTTYEIAHGTDKQRRQAMLSGAEIVISNTDAVNWMAKDPEVLTGFTHLVVDEFTHYKNRNSQRSTALKYIAKHFTYIWMLSGTPNPNTILDIWHPALILDNGKRLGRKYWNFRSQVCHPVQNGPSPQHVKWVDRPGAEDVVADLLKDITIRHRFEDCVDIPPNYTSTMTLRPPQWLYAKYLQLLEHSVLDTGEGVLTAVHAGARIKKVLQLLSGAVYSEDGEVLRIHNERYQLITDLIAARDQCVVAYNWQHEINALTQYASRAQIPFAIINGSVPAAARTQAVSAFQRGEIKAIFAHPQSAAHGLTLTRGTTTIWASPTYNAEHYQQFNRRIYRTGQTRKTETVRIAYANTKEEEVYEALDGKLTRMEDLLDLFTQQTQRRTVA